MGQSHSVTVRCPPVQKSSSNAPARNMTGPERPSDVGTAQSTRLARWSPSAGRGSLRSPADG